MKEYLTHKRDNLGKTGENVSSMLKSMSWDRRI